MIEMAIKIDNRHFERNLERRGQYSPGDHKRKGNRKSYWPQPMELDATFGRLELSSSEKERRSKERLCFTCGKPGHQARNCKQSKGKKPWNKSGKGKQLNATWQRRGGYNAPSQLNATFAGTMHGVVEEANSGSWELTSDEVAQFLATEGNDVNSDLNDSWEITSLTAEEEQELIAACKTAELQSSEEPGALTD